MSEKPPPKRTKSGETPAVQAFRKKIESFKEGTFHALEEMNRQAEAALRNSSAPPADEVDEDETEDPSDE